MKFRYALMVWCCFISASIIGQTKFSFPETEIGTFAELWFDAVNNNKPQNLYDFNLVKDDWDAYFQSIIDMADQKGGITPYLTSYYTNNRIAIYSKENNGQWVKVILGYDTNSNSILTMSVKKSFKAIPYPAMNRLTPKSVSEILSSLSNELETNYVDFRVGKSISDSLNSISNSLLKITQGDLLAEILTKKLKKFGNDKHLQIIPPSMKQEVTVRFDMEAQEVSSSGLQDIASSKIPLEYKILDGNIGYLKYDRFEYSERVNTLLAKAFKTFKSIKAIIIDLRQAGGGDGQAVEELLGYLFSQSIKIGVDNYTIPKQNACEFDDTPIKVLTSNGSISAAEALAYTLKRERRAKIIGQTTAGAGYLVDVFSITNGFYFVNSIKTRYGSDTNDLGWQGVGVVPDIRVNSSKALEEAIKDL